MSAADRDHQRIALDIFTATPPTERTAVLCRQCGTTGLVDHRDRLTIRCAECGNEAPFPASFALVRGRYAADDAARALRART